MGKETLQWHPAFYAGLQIELQEYKSPTDYLSIDDYYKGYAYACFYKADTEKQNAIPIKELTLTFVSKRYPGKLIEHLKKERGYRIEEQEKGIYYIVKGSEILPTQIIVTSRVSEEENLWLRSLTNKLENKEEVQRLIDEYQKHRSNKLYESVMNIIVKANYQEFEEVRGNMCKALEELMADVIEERVKEQVEERVKEKQKEAIDKGLQALIETCKELGLSKEDTLIRTENKFQLEREAAEKYLVEYWN